MPGLRWNGNCLPVLQLIIISSCQRSTFFSSSSSSFSSNSSSSLLHLFPRSVHSSSSSSPVIPSSLLSSSSSSPVHLPSSLHHSSSSSPSSAEKSNQRPAYLPSTNATTTTTYSCAVHLPKGCSCLKRDGFLSLNCSGTRLHSIPRTLAEVGSTVVKNLSLERNQIRGINDGDFFGLKIEHLLLGHNSIEKLDFLAFWGLENSLEKLDLSYNRFVEVPTEALRLLMKLRSLILTGNRIAAARDYDFGYLKNLGILGLDRNPISCVSTHAFAGTKLYLLDLTAVRLSPSGLEDLPTADLKHLEGLSLAGNRIAKIPTGGWFRNMKILQYLSLDDNSLKDIPNEDAFLGLEETLRTLELSGNRLHSVPAAALQRLRKLEALDLSRNRIRRLHKRPLNASHSLLSLNLSDNRISKISRRAFHGLLTIRTIDLRNNRLVTLDELAVSSLQPSPNVSTTIYLSGNPWLCNCMLKWLRRDARKQSFLSKSTNRTIGDAKSLKCDRPAEVETMQLVSVPLKDFTCDHDYYYYYYDDKDSNNGDDDDKHSHNESSSKTS